MQPNYKEIVDQVNASFTEGDTEGFLSFCADDIEWRMIGEKPVKGKTAIREFMGEMNGEPPKFTVDNVIADGEYVTAYGDMTMKDKDGKQGRYSYCDIYRFNFDKISELNSYVIKIKE